MKKNGFTLIELLVVITIIGILSATLLGSVAHFQKAAKYAKASDLVKQAATALNAVKLAAGGWPGYLIAGASKSEPMLDYDACQPLITHNAWSFSYKSTTTADGTYYKLNAADRCGIVDPWAADALKKIEVNRSADSCMNSIVPSGGKVRDHVLRYAIDLDDDGLCEVRVKGKTLKVRADVVVWGCGADGKFEDYTKSGNSDDLFSWKPGQVQK